MVSCRLDFIDKLVIVITCVIVTFICVFNTFCFADENIEITKISGIAVGTNSIISASSGSIGYAFLEPGYTYQFYNASLGVRHICFTKEIPFLGLDDIIGFAVVQVGETYTFSVPYDTSYVVFDYSWFNDSSTLTKLETTVMYQTVLDLIKNVGINNIWDTFSISLPYVGIVVLSGFGFYLIFHNIKEISKGREKTN